MHPNSQRFHELCDAAKEMHDHKQKDYGSDTDPFANVRGSENLGIPAWVGAVLRNNDKQVRLNKAAKNTVETGVPALANEGVKDSLLDQAVYALIAYVLYEEWEVTCREPIASTAEDPWSQIDWSRIGEFAHPARPIGWHLFNQSSGETPNS